MGRYHIDYMPVNSKADSDSVSALHIFIDEDKTT